MYTVFLQVHSWLGWLVVLLGLVVVLGAAHGWRSGRVFGASDNRLQTWYMAMLHLQFVIGIVLYVVLSPKTRAIFEGIDGWMQHSAHRFLVLEHPLTMIVAIAIAQIGRLRSKKAHNATHKFRIATLAYALSWGLIVSRIPWQAVW